jgi:hypothetical protein
MTINNPNFTYKGRHPSAETKLKIRETKISEKNPMWKGDFVSEGGLHDWVRRRKPKPKFCECCYCVICNKKISFGSKLCRNCYIKSTKKYKEMIK